MNQILFNSSFPEQPPAEDSKKPIHKKENKSWVSSLKSKTVSLLPVVSLSPFFKNGFNFFWSSTQNKKKPFYYAIFSLCIFSIFVALFSYGFYYYDQKQSEQFADRLSNMVRISSIYSDSSSNTMQNIPLSDSIIGSIEIPKINIYYPIFAETRDDLLKVAPCRFYGPLPNEAGNLCIAGHNYDNQKFFSNLFQLELTDEIFITDQKGKTICYTITQKTEVPSSDTSAIIPNTQGKKIVTLITCNNKNGNRLLIQAKEKD